MKVYKNLFNKIISLETLFCAWEKFKLGKQSRADVLLFEKNLESNIFSLHRSVRYGKYIHGNYEDFFIEDPKRRHIYKATVRDRVLHHAVFSILRIVFEPSFIPTSFSCRINKGNHRGIVFLKQVIRKVSENYTKKCFVLKCDIKKFFDTIDHDILLEILSRKIKDADAVCLLEEIIVSYSIGYERERERESKNPSKRNTYRQSDVAALCQCVYE